MMPGFHAGFPALTIKLKSKPSLCLETFFNKPQKYSPVAIHQCKVNAQHQLFRIDEFKVKLYPKQKLCFVTLTGLKEHSRIQTGDCSWSEAVEVKREGLQIKLKNRNDLCLGFYFIEHYADLMVVKCSDKSRTEMVMDYSGL